MINHILLEMMVGIGTRHKSFILTVGHFFLTVCIKFLTFHPLAEVTVYEGGKENLFTKLFTHLKMNYLHVSFLPFSFSFMFYRIFNSSSVLQSSYHKYKCIFYDHIVV